MRVLSISNAFPIPGLEANGIFVAREVQGLRALGVDVDVFRSGFRREFRRNWREWRTRLAQVQPDLVHVYMGSIGALAVSLRCPVPLVMTFGGPDLLGPARSDPLIERTVGGLAVVLSQIAAPNADAIVVRSEQLRGRLLRKCDRARAQVIPAGVDPEVFRPLERTTARRAVGWEGAEPIVLFGASRNRAVKRFELARAAVNELAARGIRVRLETCERISPECMPLFLNAADCLVLTSQHEGSPNIVKEAVACGCPVVSLPVGDVPAILEGVWPSRIATAAPGSLAGAMQEVLTCGQRSNGPERMRSHYTLPAVARRLCALYDETLAAWRIGRRHGWRTVHCRALPTSSG